MSAISQIVRQSNRLITEATLNGAQRITLRVLAHQGDGTPGKIVVQPTEIDLRSDSARQRLLKALDEPVRVELAPVLADLNNDIHERRLVASTAAEPESGESLQGSALAFPDPTPYPEPVDGTELLDDIAALLERYVVLPTGAAVMISLWVVLTWTYSAFDICPILGLRSAEPRCGKTTLLGILARLVRRNLATSDATPAAVFRVVEQFAPTLLADEADAFFRDNEALRGIFNSGHTRDAAYVLRVEGDSREVRRFSTWAPKALVGIGAMPRTITDRSIVVALKRKLPHERREKARRRRLAVECAAFPARLARWATDHMASLAGAEDATIPDGCFADDDRAADNWGVLLSIADEVAGDWPKKARAALRQLVLDRPADANDSEGVELLRDFHLLFQDRGDRVSSEDAHQHMVSLDRWADYYRGREITKRRIAMLLAGYGIRPRQDRSGGPKFRGYSREDFLDAFARYLPLQSGTSGTALSDTDLVDAQTGTAVPDHAAAKSLRPNAVPLVPDQPPRSPATDTKSGGRHHIEWEGEDGV